LVTEEFPLPGKIGTPPTEGKEESISIEPDGPVLGRGEEHREEGKIQSVAGSVDKARRLRGVCKFE
jgi:hypothetical protein